MIGKVGDSDGKSRIGNGKVRKEGLRRLNAAMIEKRNALAGHKMTGRLRRCRQLSSHLLLSPKVLPE